MPLVAIVAVTATVQAGSLADPSGSSAIVGAVQWLEGTLLGTLASSVAVIAVAWVGLLMLAGRLELRRGLTVILGCFVLFGAATIAAGIRGAAGSGPAVVLTPPPRTAVPPVPPPSPAPGNADPYAGAAMPTR
jgi:type IV secretory pathway VirB2 component (pilin)